MVFDEVGNTDPIDMGSNEAKLDRSDSEAVEGISQDQGGPPSIYNHYSSSEKKAMLLTAAFVGLLTPFTDTIYLPALQDVGLDLRAPATAGATTVSAYLAAVGIGQLVFGPLADRFGRLTVIYPGLLLFEAMTIGCIFAPNINSLIVLRTLEGFFISSSVVSGGFRQMSFALLYRKSAWAGPLQDPAAMLPARARQTSPCVRGRERPSQAHRPFLYRAMAPFSRRALYRPASYALETHLVLVPSSSGQGIFLPWFRQIFAYRAGVLNSALFFCFLLRCMIFLSAVQALIADVFAPHERGTAMGTFMGPLLIGPVIAPLIGGALSAWRGWRATFVLLAVLTGPIVVSVFLFIRHETLPYFAAKRFQLGLKPLLPNNPTAAEDAADPTHETKGKPGDRRAALEPLTPARRNILLACIHRVRRASHPFRVPPSELDVT